MVWWDHRSQRSFLALRHAEPAQASAASVALGRPSIEESNTGKYEAIKAALAAKKGIRRIARELQTGVGTVLRIKAEYGRPLSGLRPRPDGAYSASWETNMQAACMSWPPPRMAKPNIGLQLPCGWMQLMRYGT